MVNIIFETITGSKLYGTDISGSDTDTKGVCILDKKEYNGFLNRFEQYNDPNKDTEIYDIRKAFRLMANANPNMYDLLFAPKKFWLKQSKSWNNIYRNRYEFLSKKARHTYAGYAFSQLNRIKRHRSWLLNPVLVKPKRDFKCPVSKDLIKTVLSIPNNILADNIKDDVKKEIDYQYMKNDYNNYQGWLKNRNKDRAATELKVGYDSKHAAHLVRLLVTCKEILTEGTVIVDRRGIDADMLKSIRNCEWSYEKLIGVAEDMDIELGELYKTSTLKNKPNMNLLNDLCVEVTEEFHGEKISICNKSNRLAANTKCR